MIGLLVPFEGDSSIEVGYSGGGVEGNCIKSELDITMLANSLG